MFKANFNEYIIVYFRNRPSSKTNHILRKAGRVRVGPTDRTIGTSDYFLNSKSEASKCFEEIDI